MAISHAQIIAQELSLTTQQVERTLALFAEGATLPFVARYRKEATGGLDEVALGKIGERGEYLKELDARRATVLREIGEQGKLSDALKHKIEATMSKTELEDLYLPFKPKRRTRATIAKERGLGPLAEQILAQRVGAGDRASIGAAFIDAAKEVPDLDAAFAGARDIVAEVISERADVRARLREMSLADGVVSSRVLKGKDTEGAKYKDYFDWKEPVAKVPSHRMLAMRRGEKEGFLKLALEVDEPRALGEITARVVSEPRATLHAELGLAITDAWERLLQSSIEVDVRLALKERADAEAIQVFSENLRPLLLASPLGQKRVLAIDPGYRTGCKIVTLDAQGHLLEHDVIFPTMSEGRVAEAERRLVELLTKHRVEAIAVGNGTAGREAEAFARNAVKARGLDIKVIVVNESGASVYSASEIAREELPTEDVTVRGAVSIGRRLQDPLAELVKIDPKAIGVGQYQHDVNQTQLKRSLDMVVESCVNKVGVDVNTASVKLLEYVAGIGETIAKNIIAHRGDKGAFKSRRALSEVPRLGAKAFEQAAGFLRIRSGDNPLDNSAVHPESYDVVEKMAKDLKVGVAELVGNASLLRSIEPSRYVDDQRGLPTIVDIVAELEKPGRDPRAEFVEVGFDPDVTEFQHVKEGMQLNGVVTNVTKFGAFVDIGVHQDGLVHISELSNQFVKDPAEVVKVGDRVRVRVLAVDLERKRLGLSMKTPSAERPAPKPQAAKTSPSTPGQSRGPSGPRPQKPSAPPPPKAQPFNNAFAGLANFPTRK